MIPLRPSLAMDLGYTIKSIISFDYMPTCMKQITVTMFPRPAHTYFG